MKRSHVILSIFLFSALICLVGQIVVSTAFATDGITYGAVKQQTDTLAKENMLLKEQVYSLASLTAIDQRAQTMGFAQDKNANLTITSPLPFAMR